MAPYIVVASALIVLAVLETASAAETRIWGRIALVLVLTFGAVRYQTGYDWLAYETYFDTAVNFRTALSGGIPQQDLPMEPLYLLLNMSVKSFGGSIILLFFLIAVFNICVIHVVSGKISHSQSLVWAVYFCVAFPIAQMSAIRHALGASFVLIGLLYAANQRPYVGFFHTAVAVGIHASEILFAPLLLVRNKSPAGWLVTVVVVLGLIAVFVGIHPVDPVIYVVSPHLPEWLSEKLAIYSGGQSARLSIGSGLLVAGYMILLLFFYRKATRKDRQDPFMIVAIWLTLLVLGAHLFLSGFPAIWNRVMCVSLPWQIAAFCRTEAFAAWRTGQRLAIVSSLGVVALAGLIYLLVKPESKPLVPYHSLLQVWIFNDEGDGRIRSEEWLKEYETTIMIQR